MEIFHSPSHQQKYLKLVLKILLALLLIQLLRMAVFGGLWIAVHPGDNITLFQFINGLDLIIVGLILLFYFKPSLDELGLKWDDIRRRTRLFYVVGALILVVLIIIPYTFGWELQILILGLVFGIVTPMFEELLFRGYIWGKISQSGGMINPDVLTLITVTLLFMLWHIGYLDVLILHPRAPTNLTMIIISKVGVGMILGLIVGYIRLKTGKTYGSLLFHCFWNIFAP